MAPEQAEGKVREVGPLVDVYALGAILYETLTGRPPFQGETTLDTLVQVRFEDPIPPRRLQRRVARDLETISLKCLEKDPRKRYPSAKALAQDLERFLARESIHARPTPIWERGAKWARRRPALASVWAISAIAMAIILIGWIRFTSELTVERNNALAAQKRAEEQERFARQEQRHASEEHAVNQAILQRACRAVGDYARVVEEGKLLARINEDPGSLLYVLARFYALASAACRGDRELPPPARGKLAEEYARSATELLIKARDHGYFNSARAAQLRTDADFDALRSRAAFQKLLRELGMVG
jgi:hypothetical protein